MVWNKKPIEWVVTEKGCFEVTSHSTDTRGYIQVHRNKKTVRLHRYIYEQMFGELSKELYVCHKCDNRKCINPEHLFLGTHQENQQDKINKGRLKFGTSSGEQNGNSKLKLEDIIYIRSSNKDNKELAKELNVSTVTIHSIKSYNTWKYT